MLRHAKSLRRPAAPLILGALLVLLAAPRGPAFTDDRDLLRFNTANPYLFILLDTSGSMNLQFGAGDNPTVGHGDDPDSRLYAAKAALFQVFESVDDVNFGFATFNQDELRTISKHWLYYYDGALGGGWPLNWPIPDADGLVDDEITVDTDGDGTPDAPDGIPDNDVEGDALVFGRHINQAPVGQAGTCNNPLDLDNATERAKFNAFPRLHDPDNPQATVMWLEEGGLTYRMVLNLTPSAGNKVGNPILSVDVVLDRVASCVGPVFDLNVTTTEDLKLDPFLNEFLMIDRGVPGGGGGNNASEKTAALWPWQDALGITSCGTAKPFSGKGWEGNYDGGIVTGDPAFDAEVTDVDEFCPAGPGTCRDLKYNPTQLDALSRTLDKGDMLPFDWTASNKTTFLQRLAPNYESDGSGGPPDFRVSPHLVEDPATGLYVAASRPPLIARGETPMGKSILDFRCWYLGQGGSNKCRDHAYFIDDGWSDVACTYDSEWGCRRPFLVVISDGDDTCPGENPAADTANLNSKSGIKVWALNVGDPGNCQGGSPLKSITSNGKGDCVNVANKEELLGTLQDILNTIREESRAFASAAVPSVQATADESLFHASFTPLRQKSVWDGHLNSFLKPLPTDPDGKPITDPKCSDLPPTQQSGCFLWDVGEVLVTSQVPGSNPLGSGPNQRRVYYSRQSTSGAWHSARRFFDPTTDGTAESIRYDLWRGLGLIPPSMPDDALDPTNESTAQTRANAVIAQTLAVKTATLAETGETINYILGDIFHSDPVVIGSPTNTGAFVADSSGATCDLTNGNDSYRCFFKKHRFRRKLLTVGSNDGMLHFFNSGIYDETAGKYDNGTGHELLAYMPRGVMPTVKQLAEGTNHRYTVDGQIVVADVFIHPGHNGTPQANQRQWRTVLFGSLREGGRSYFALDVTQPDNLTLNAGGEFIPDPGGDYVPSCITNPTNCGPVPFGSAVWEFDDSIYDAVSGQFVKLDEDGNAQSDLGFTWSKPNVGVIQVCAGGSPCDPEDPNSTVDDVPVIVFGGGMDPDNKTVDDPDHGNWLYIVAIETGEVLYKRELLGAVPSEPAAVDTNSDGVLDRIYVGTTAGYLYRVDLTVDGSGNLPALVTESVTGMDGGTYSVSRIPAAFWAPRVVFDTVGPRSDSDATAVRRPLYFRPSVLFVAKLGLYALSFGGGDREDLWATSLSEGRYYTLVDDTDASSSPITEADLVVIDATTGAEASADFLLTRSAGQRGWVLTLEPDERVITEGFALSGVTIFSSFQPEVPLTDQNGNPLSNSGSCTSSFQKDTDNFCSRGGSSRIFVVNTTNANGFLFDVNDQSTRFNQVSDFVTEPFSEQGQNKNPGATGGGGLTVDQQRVMESLKSLYPDNCRFAHFRIDIRTIASDTSVQHIASVPVCMIEKNWKEF